ncbi:MAG: ankyrin repeat domain-containing protein [Lewinella sp.]
MPYRCTIVFALLFLTISCGSSAEVEDLSDYVPPPIINRIARYDVSHLALTADDLDLPYQKMTSFHVLQLAAIYCDSALMAQTLANGADPNIISRGYHLMPEVATCSDNGLVLTKMMVNAGADVNGSDEYNDNALSFAIGAGDTELVGYLLDNGADLNQRDNDEAYGCNPIHRVATAEMLKFLLDRGASLDEICTSGRTLLHFAAETDNADFIRYLLENEIVDPNSTDYNGETAYDYATANASSAAQTLLRPE